MTHATQQKEDKEEHECYLEMQGKLFQLPQ